MKSHVSKPAFFFVYKIYGKITTSNCCSYKSCKLKNNFLRSIRFYFDIVITNIALIYLFLVTPHFHIFCFRFFTKHFPQCRYILQCVLIIITSAIKEIKTRCKQLKSNLRFRDLIVFPNKTLFQGKQSRHVLLCINFRSMHSENMLRPAQIVLQVSRTIQTTGDYY